MTTLALVSIRIFNPHKDFPYIPTFWTKIHFFHVFLHIKRKFIQFQKILHSEKNIEPISTYSDILDLDSSSSFFLPGQNHEFNFNFYCMYFYRYQCCGSRSGRIRTFLSNPDPIKSSGSDQKL